LIGSMIFDTLELGWGRMAEAASAQDTWQWISRSLSIRTNQAIVKMSAPIVGLEAPPGN